MQSGAGRDDGAARVLDSLRRLVRAIRVSAHSVEHELQIGGAQLFVLRELAAEPGCSIRRLSARTLTDPSSVSVVVARLVKRGLISCRQDSTDARRTELSLTARGEWLLARAGEPFQVRLVRTLQALPRARLRRLAADLATVVREVGAHEGAALMFFDDEPKRRNHHGS